MSGGKDSKSSVPQSSVPQSSVSPSERKSTDTDETATSEKAEYSRSKDEATVKTAGGLGKRPSRLIQAKEYLSWKLRDVFDWNPNYVKQLRGILVIVEVVSSMMAMSLICSACQMLPFGLGRDEGVTGFFCQSAETFLFVISCSSFISSLLMLLCCLLSKKSESRLAKTSFELSFYVLYFLFFLMSCLILISKISNQEPMKVPSRSYYNQSLAAAVFGNIACIAYALSVGWYFVTFKNCSHECQ